MVVSVLLYTVYVAFLFGQSKQIKKFKLHSEKHRVE